MKTSYLADKEIRDPKTQRTQDDSYNPGKESSANYCSCNCENNFNHSSAHALLECGYCKEIGHIKKNCQKKKDADAKLRNEDSSASGSKNKNGQQWLVDSGSDSHVTNSLTNLDSIHRLDLPTIRGVNGSAIYPKAQGNLNLKYIINKEDSITLNKVLFTPESRVNLMSVSEITKVPGNKVVFVGNKAKIFQKNKLVLETIQVNGLYQF
jgi:hypothetical protein